MSDSIKQWNEALASSQQTFFKALFPALAEGVANLPKGGLAPSVQDQLAELQTTWNESIGKWAAHVKDSSGNAFPTANELQAMFSPASWNGKGAGVFEASLQHVIEGPKYATLWDLERKLAKLQKLMIQRDKDVMAYQAIVQRAWNSALKRFSESFPSATEPPPTTWREMIDRWLATANDVLIETYRTDEFIEAQRRMLRAASEYRIQEREIAEAWCEACHVPTRSEMDEMQRLVTDLRRQVRLLQRQAAPQAAVRGASVAPKNIRTTSKVRRSTARAQE